MRITDLHVDGFGVWSDLRLKRLSPELTVFYGPNEAGKTTLMQFLRTMLYGADAHRRQRYLPPVHGGRPGGRLGALSEAGAFEVTRYTDRDPATVEGEDRGLVRINLPDGTTQGDRLLRDALEGVDEATFNNVFAIGLDEIQALGTLSGAQVAKHIYRLTSGLDRVSLYDVIMDLRSERQRLLAGPGEPSVLGDLLARRDELQTEISELAIQNRRWSKLAVELDETEKKVAATRGELKEAERAARRIEVAITLKPHWRDRLRIDERLADFASLHVLPEGAIEQLDAFNEEIAEHRRQRDILRGQRKQLGDEAEELGVNETLVRNCCRLDALGEQQEWVESLERDTAELAEEAERLETQVESEQRRLGSVWMHDPEHTPELTEEMTLDLEPHADTLAKAEKEFRRAEEVVHAKRGSEQQYHSKIKTAMTLGDKLGLPTDHKEAGELVARLRRRLQVEQRLEQSRRNAMELEQQGQELLDRQVMPMEWFIGLAGLSILCGVLFGLWLLGRLYDGSSYSSYGGWAALLGIAGPVLIGFIKYFAEEAAADKLDAVQRQTDIVNKQIDEANRDKAKLDVELPMTEGSVLLQLQKAEQHLAEIERVLPVETQRQAATQEVQAAERDLASAKERLERAKGVWTETLSGLGLPERLSPGDVRTLAGQYEMLNELRTKAENRREEAERRERELARVAKRVQSLAEEADLVLEAEDEEEEVAILDQLEVLLSERRLQQSRIDHREKLIERAKELKEKEIKRHKAAQATEQRRDALFHTAGCADEEVYRRLAADLATAAELREQRESVTREIAAAIGRLGTETDFAPLMAEDAIGRLDATWEELSAQQERLEAVLQELLAHRGTLAEQRKNLGADTALADKQMELDQIDARVERAKEDWRERAVIGQLLELVRSDYEENRQPETLQEASRYMEQLTSGQYTRVWTPLANDILLVDNRDGQSLGVDALSRGTREQLLLSVRMALVAMYARRGVQLPMILDDVLVNFDAGRAKTAAMVMRDFAAAGHQLLVFTCHEHVWEMFKDLSVDVRRLPARDGAVIEPEPVVETVVEAPVEEVVEEVIEEVAVTEPEPEPQPAPEPEPEPEPLPVEAAYEELPVEPLPVVEAVYDELAPTTTTVTEYEVVEQSAPVLEKPIEHETVEVALDRSAAAAIATETEYRWDQPNPAENGYQAERLDGSTEAEPHVYADLQRPAPR